MKRISYALIISMTLVACGKVGANYQSPSINLAPQFVNGGSQNLVDAASIKWWQSLNDPILDSLVERGAVQNLDVQTALERVSSAQSALGRVGVNGQAGGGLTSTFTRQGSDLGVEESRRSVFDARYVLDLFGGAARDREQAQANFGAAQVNVGAVRLAYLAELTGAYVQARYYQSAAAITRTTIQSRRQTLNIVSQRRQAGEATELEVQQARAELASTEANLPVLSANFETNVFRIATLLAEPTAPILRQMQQGARQPRPSGFTTSGHPADLLRNRPDIQAAERSLAAATAAVGIADAQLYPSVTLNGSLGSGASDGWSFGPSLTVPLLNRGVLRANKQVAESAARQAEFTWRNTVLKAVEEVQGALSLSQNWRRQLTSYERAGTASGTVLRLSRESYRGGEIPLADVLDAERQHASNRLAEADAVRNFALNWLDVQITTGRGWLTAPQARPSETLRPKIRPDPFGLMKG